MLTYAGEMLGSSMIVAGLVFAVVAIAVPFRLIPADFLRNVFFLLISLIWLVFILLDSTISTAGQCLYFCTSKISKLRSGV